mgnify:CR=1 FL=1|tara:strand:+ start:444 stop:584 length:141 start_codon:yes stop_codon:yes gene_type:complete
MLELGWSPSEIRKATAFDIQLAIKAYNKKHNPNKPTAEDVKRWSKL